MTSKNTLYTRDEYQQLIFGALRPETYGFGGRIRTLPPAIFRPVPRWTGKQVISTILLNVTPPHAQGLNMNAKARVGAKYWGEQHKEEEVVVVRDGELLTGVLDKSQIGASAYGLVHAVYEIYGAETAGRLLSIFSRLFTMWLQHNAFSCRMDDLLLSADGEPSGVSCSWREHSMVSRRRWATSVSVMKTSMRLRHSTICACVSRKCCEMTTSWRPSMQR